MSLVRRLLGEPLFHFFLIGGALFALHRQLAPSRSGQRLRVTAQLRAGLRADFQRRSGAPPSAAEEQALVDRYVDQEVLYREALALGLDRGDVIVRRRLVQKLELLLEELDPVPEPDDRALERWLQAHPARYASGPRRSFEQVFVAAGPKGVDPVKRAEAIRQRLLAGAQPAGQGDPFLGGRAFREQSERTVASRFGAPFAAALWTQAPGTWSAPLRSAYGLHLVRVEADRPQGPAFDEARGQLRRDLLADERARRDRLALERLRARYQIEVTR
jgi:peptidyl-prolyl cis-trans isomerase C